MCREFQRYLYVLFAPYHVRLVQLYLLCKPEGLDLMHNAALLVLCIVHSISLLCMRRVRQPNMFVFFSQTWTR